MDSLIALPPESLEFEPTNRCNLKCVHCSSQYFKTSDEDAPADLFGKMPLSRINTIHLHGRGEPLMYRGLIDIIKLCPPGTARFSTNGLLLDKNHAINFIDLKIGAVIFSLDAANAETYRKIRGADFSKVLENITTLTQAKKTSASELPHVIVNMTLMKTNLYEAPGLVSLAKEVGANEVQYFTLNPEVDYTVARSDWTFNYKEEMLDDWIAEHDRVVRESQKLAESLGIGYSYFGAHKKVDADYVSSSKDIFCLRPWQNLLVNATGEARLCCYHSETIGNLNEMHWTSVWNGDAAMMVRAHMFDEFPSICHDCPIYLMKRRTGDIQQPKRLV